MQRSSRSDLLSEHLSLSLSLSVRPHEPSARRKLDKSERVTPPGLSYFDKTAAMDSDDEFFSDDEDLEAIPEIYRCGRWSHITVFFLHVITHRMFSKVFGLLRLSRDEIDAMLPAVHVLSTFFYLIFSLSRTKQTQNTHIYIYISQVRSQQSHSRRQCM